MIIYKIFYIFLFISTNVFAISNYKIFVKTHSAIRKVPKEFLSVSLDTNIAQYRWCELNFTYVVPLAKELSPGYLRFGGTEADALIFQEHKLGAEVMEDRCNRECPAHVDKGLVKNFTFYGYQLDQIYNFAKNSGLRFIFDLNMVLRNGSRWDATNAIKLINYAKKNSYDFDFELGNEPNHYGPYYALTVNGSQIAKDYRYLRRLLNSYPEYKHSKLIGPSMASYAQILKDFVKNGGTKYVDGLSFHFYYLAGETAKLHDFINHTVLDYLENGIRDMKNLTNGSIWLGEGSSAYSGGAPNISDTYASGFIYLDMLGLSAARGVDVVVRQDFFHGNYSLLNDSMKPNHDYWIALLHKKLVGRKILDIRFHPIDKNLRLYAACSKKSKGLVIYGVKLDNQSFSIDMPQFYDQKAEVFLLKEATVGDLQSKRSRLNGRLLEWDPDRAVPQFHGQLKSFPITLPGYSQFFIGISERIKACH